MSSEYPTINDREFNLLKKIANNTALLADDEAGDVASITGTANQITVSQPTGAVTLSLPSTVITSRFEGGSGTAAAPSFSFSTDTAKGFYRRDADSIGIAIHGTLDGILYSPSAGELQVINGNANGTLRIDANGAIYLTSSGTNKSITLTPSGTGYISTSAAYQVSGAFPGTPPAYSISRNSTGSGQLQFNGGASGTIWNNSTNTTNNMLLTDGGHLLLGGLTTDGTGVLQFPAATTSAGGITFGTDTFWYRSAAGTLTNAVQSASVNCNLQVVGGASLQHAAYLAITPGSGDAAVGTSTATGFRITTGGTTAVTFDTSQGALFSGNVALGAGLQLSVDNIATKGGGLNMVFKTGAGVTTALTLDGNQCANFAAGVNATSATLTYSGTPAIDMRKALQTITLTGIATFSTSNRAAGAFVTLRVISDSVDRALTFPAWRWVGSSAPAIAVANKVAILSLTCFGANETDIAACWVSEL